jgi:hypothetical protein
MKQPLMVGKMSSKARKTRDDAMLKGGADFLIAFLIWDDFGYSMLITHCGNIKELA